MSRRLEFHDILMDLLGSSNVYFQPPATAKIKYPCIIYKRNRVDANHADDCLYQDRLGYLVTVIDINPDSEIPGKILKLPFCRFDRHYTAENLNHDVFNVYY